MPNQIFYFRVRPEVCVIKTTDYGIVTKSTSDRHEVVRLFSKIYST